MMKIKKFLKPMNPAVSRSIRNVKKELARYRDYAKSTLQKNKRINHQDIGKRSDAYPEEGDRRRSAYQTPDFQRDP